MAIDTKEEAKWYNLKKKLAVGILLAECVDVDKMIMRTLRKAFTEGYTAKHDYDEAQKIFIKSKKAGKNEKCKCACHKTKDKEKGTCGKCYTIQCSWWEGKNFEYADCEGLWVGKKEGNR